MTNLSHWNFAETFSGNEAALLMLGIDPANAEQGNGKITPVVQRMRSSYEGALSAAVWAYEFNDSANGKLPDPIEHPKHFYSHRMFDINGYDYEFHHPPKKHWLKDEGQRIFEKQIFSRAEIARWISAHAMSSIYLFRLEPESLNSTGVRWPWGDHHTELLGHLDAAARRYWLNYDPSDTGTASTNVTVSKWLQTERKVSRTMADAIASMLRADGLPTGPRK